MSSIIDWKVTANPGDDENATREARGDHTLSLKGDSKLRRSLQFLGGLSPSADGTFDWPLETAGKVLGEVCGLDASARALHFLRFMVSAPALDKVGVTLTAAGLFDEVYATLPAWQARVQKWLAEEALDTEKEALTLSDTGLCRDDRWWSEPTQRCKRPGAKLGARANVGG